MNHTLRSGTVYGNQGGPVSAGTQPISSCEGLGHFRQNAPGLGAGSKQATGLISGNAPSKNRRYGGQASGPGLFGLRLAGDTGTAPKAAAVRPVQQARPIGDDQPRRAGSLSFGQRRAIIRPPHPAEVERRNAAMRAAAVASERRDERDWSELAALAACPEWERTLPFGSVETALALND